MTFMECPCSLSEFRPTEVSPLGSWLFWALGQTDLLALDG